MELLLFEESNASHSASVRRCLPDEHLVLCTETFDNVSTPTIFSYLVGLARKHSLLASWQTTVLSQREFFESLKIVCCRLNLASHGEFNVTDSHVICAHSAYVSETETNPSAAAYREFLKDCNAIDQFGLLKLLQQHHEKLKADLDQSFRIEGTIRSAWQSAAVAFLAANKPKRRVQIELPVVGDVAEIANSQIRFESVDECYPKYVLCPKESQSLVYTLTILKSFLNLLVNSRDEVAIACALACPLVNLSHEAFTVVKRAASEDKSPIYQFVLSYVAKKRLRASGGDASTRCCPVAKYAKELTDFVDIMDRLQTLIEDSSISSAAVDRITGCILGKLSKSIRVGQPMKLSMIDKARSIVSIVLERIKSQNVATDSTINPGIIGKDTISVLRTLADELATLGYHQKPAKWLCSPFSAATPSKTPVGAQTLFRLFKSPKEARNDDNDDNDNDDHNGDHNDNDNGDHDDDHNGEQLVPLAKRAPIKTNVPPQPVVAFSVKYEPEPPKRHLYAENDQLRQADQQTEQTPLTPLNSNRKTSRLNNRINDATPIVKNSKKRKNPDDKKKAAKKRLILPSNKDQENRAPREPKANVVKKSHGTQNKSSVSSMSNQRSIHSFFARI